MRTMVACLGFTLLAVGAPYRLVAQQQLSQRPYNEGPVVVFSYVRTNPGMFNKYIQYLQTDWKRLQEAAKAEGIVLNYRVLQSPVRSADDHDLILVVEYKNMAAMDGLNERVDPLLARVFGSLPQSDQKSVERGAMRTGIGERSYRELILK